MSLNWEPLSRENFANFGDVIEVGAGTRVLINDGTTVRHDDLANVDVAQDGGRPVVSIFESSPFDFPLQITMLERHPKGSQAFIPLDDHPYFVVVAPRGESVSPEDMKIFLATGKQGVNYPKGIWHHPVIVMNPMNFLVIDRSEAETNCDLFHFPKSGDPLVLERP
ncbi:MAG: ureidoglycolate lyase [Rhodospirillales bacterium]|jgi:ureidoglycolate lyase|nr:ureidoglycolate lyase [Rhodospirillales bacterium]